MGKDPVNMITNKAKNELVIDFKKDLLKVSKYRYRKTAISQSLSRVSDVITQDDIIDSCRAISTRATL